MPVALSNMRDELLPGLVKAYERYSFGFNQWDSIYGAVPVACPSASIIAEPMMIPLKEAAVLAAAAVLVKNPVVSRRFWHAPT